ERRDDAGVRNRADDEVQAHGEPPSDESPSATSGDRAATAAPSVGPLPPVDDFLALGLAVVLLEMLSRHMHYFAELDDVLLEAEAVAAAEAWQAGDERSMRSRLQRCFDALAESREHFYAAECYLFDVCLLDTEFAGNALRQRITEWEHEPASLLVSGRTIEELDRLARGDRGPSRRPRSSTGFPDTGQAAETLDAFRRLLRDGKIELIGGEFGERAAPLIPLDSWLQDLQRGLSVYRRVLGTRPACWGRQRFGLSPHLPQLLRATGFSLAFHLALDDGLYPDVEQLTFRWEAPDGTQLLAVNRLPLAADSATSLLNLPARLGDSMQEDQVAGLLLFHWPDLRRPWLNDLKTICRYAPIFGAFRGISVLAESSDIYGRLAQYRPDEYLTPFLSQWAAYGEADPVSRLVAHYRNRWRLETLRTAHALAWSIRQEVSRRIDWPRVEMLVEAAGSDAFSVEFAEVFDPSPGDDADRPDADRRDDGEQNRTAETHDGSDDSSDTDAATPEAEAARAAQRARAAQQAAREALDTAAETVAADLRAALTIPAEDASPTHLIVNPLSFQRRWLWERPGRTSVATSEAVRAVQHDDDRTFVLVDLPPCGFAAVPEQGRPLPLLESPAPIADETLLQNEYFEVDIHPETGGIARVKLHGRSPNRLSQMPAFRFLREQTLVLPDESDEDETTTTYYSLPRCRALRVLRNGPLVGEIETHGELLHPTDHAVLATFTQRFRIARGQRHFDVFIELQPRTQPTGAPWATYYGCRWAYHDSTAAVSAIHWGTVHPCVNDRIESPLGFEIATEAERTTIATGGVAFHRRTGPRMIDTILLAENETARMFHFRVSVDVPYPMQTAADLLAEPVVVSCAAARPAAKRGWLFHVDHRNVQILRLSCEPDALACGWTDAAAVADQRDRPAPSPNAPADRPSSDDSAHSETHAPADTFPADAANSLAPPSAEPSGPTNHDELLWLRLVETDGRPTAARVECFRRIERAWLFDPASETPVPLAVDQGAVTVELPAHAIRTIALQFG
ncbi:MAG: hypothetical protein D6725_17175, partial [Planctomycetota bacterium]